MRRKIFVSYKYGDHLVRDLSLFQRDNFGQLVKIGTKARHYVDKLAEILKNEENIYKGEEDGQSLKNFSEEYIASALRDKIYDSSVTIVLISKGMKSSSLAEKDQWIPWEISYSLKEVTRNDRTCRTNAVIALVIPDESGSYEYFITYDNICDCRHFKTDILFGILRKNMFNQKNPITKICSNGSTVYYGDYSFITTVKWDDFLANPQFHIEKSVEIRDNKANYEISKTID